MDLIGPHNREPDRSYLHQRKFRRTMEDVRTRRGA
ncbi:unnamed protein product, partial [Schistosoma mattheei]